VLVVWRRAGQSVIIGEDTEIEVLDARANRVKLGIKAPASVAIVRKEAQLTRNENLTAAWSMDELSIKSLLSRLPRLPSKI
jgi:carbon storage regulator